MTEDPRSDVHDLTISLFGTVPDSIVDGPGLRYAVFVQGCSHGCPGGAVKTLAEVDGLGKGDDAAWIRRTFARYVTDEASLMQYVLEALA